MESIGPPITAFRETRLLAATKFWLLAPTRPVAASARGAPCWSARPPCRPLATLPLLGRSHKIFNFKTNLQNGVSVSALVIRTGGIT
jgi:hypothetical protein